MQKTFRKKLLVTLLAGVMMPLAASAADADLQKKIEAMSREFEALSRELAALKSQVKANEEKAAKTEEQVMAVTAKSDAGALDDLKSQVKMLGEKSLGKWLTVSGDYRFRYDYLKGETKPYTDVVGTFANAQNNLQAAFFNNPSADTGQQITGMMAFQGGMNAVKTYQQAVAFMNSPQTGQMLQGLGPQMVNVPAYKPENSSLYTNRFGLDIDAKATQDVSVHARLLMYKVFGSQDDSATTNAGTAPYFADRVGVFDGTLGHVPSNSYLDVDRVYATWKNIADEPIWFSIGRRPSTGGAPSNLRLNNPRPGNGGTPSLLVDYAFDGMTVGYAPDIDGLPGAYGKICYGRGFESGYRNTPANSLKDT
ncbi:MAG: DUF3373 family protein, partial [Georgfuchsia sp.]